MTLSKPRPRLLANVPRISLLVGVLGLLISVAAVAQLILADLVSTSSSDSSSLGRRLRRVLKSGDHLHFAVHLIAGRLLDLCPLTASEATVQYRRATWHARSERQLRLVTDQRPISLPARASDSLDLAARWLRWSLAEIPKHYAHILK